MAKRLGERLVDAGIATTEAVEKALEHQKITGYKLGDCLVELGLVPEAALLRFLAAEFQTRFVSADKLSKAKLASDVLDKLPVRMAEAQNVLPLAYDPERKLLSIVAAEPQNKSLLDEIALVTGVSEVYAYIGLRSAIAAAIKKHYYGDPTAFVALETGGAAQTLRPDAAPSSGEGTGSGKVKVPNLQLRMETEPLMRMARGGTQAARMPTQMREALNANRSSVPESDFIEMMNILVGQLEQERPHHRGHSAQLARQAAIVGRRMGMAPRELASLAMAAYLHDLGKVAERHHTLASNAVNADWKNEAKRLARTPVKLVETVHLPPAVNTILGQLYEAYDGSGTPQGTQGEDISLGARILSTVDSFLDLTKNPANAHGKVLTKAQALDHLRKNAGVLYDPVVADIVGQVQSGELLRHRIENDGRQVLIAESDEATRTDMLESVLRQGLVVHAFSTLEGALDALTQQDCDVLVLSLRFGLPDVTALLHYARSTAESAGLPILVLGEPDNTSRERLLMAGATAVAASSDTDKAAEQVKQLYLDRILHNGPARVVRGSYDELPLAELLKTLASGRKSGRLHLRHHSLEGYLHLEHGKVIYASYAGQSGEAAMTALLNLRQADFQYDPDSLLLDLPHLDKELEAVVKDLGARRPAQA
jgi:response regulator RpfG family c-di-GMP phosphodiesterase